MTAQPQWSDSQQRDLLELVALGTPQGDADDEWECFVSALRVAARDGVIDQNVVRPLIRGAIKPNRIGAFYSRACARDLIRASGWSTSADREGRNAGRPMRTYSWIGGTR